MQVQLQGVYDLQVAEVMLCRSMGHRVQYVAGFSKVCPPPTTLLSARDNSSAIVAASTDYIVKPNKDPR